MKTTEGLDRLKYSINQDISREAKTLMAEFDRVRSRINMFVSESAAAYKPLRLFFDKIEMPRRESEPQGFYYGYETITDLSQKESVALPMIYPFLDVPATAIDISSECAFTLLNFALRAIISYPLGDSIVYMMDSNVSGDFNQLSPISTDVDNTNSDNNQFHYITSDTDKNKVLDELVNSMDRNIRNYMSRYQDLYSYNQQNEAMHVPYQFLFINDISGTLTEKSQIDKLAKLMSAKNATKAGIYIFFTYDKRKIEDGEVSYFSDTYKAINNLLSLTNVIERPIQHYSGSEITLESKADYKIITKAISFVQNMKKPVTIMSFKDEINKMLSSGKLWMDNNREKKYHLYIPVGYKNAITKEVIDLTFDNGSPHIFIGGKIGSGKTILLHNFVLNSALKYSPSQLQFFMADMKGGVSFVKYKNLPHVAALSASSNRHYAESLLDYCIKEMERREHLFKRVGATLLDDYNEVAVKQNMPTLPYVFCIIDEFQELFTKTDSVAKNAQSYIERIHKKARYTGIFLALCTQSAPSNTDRSQVGVKLSLVCSLKDSIALIGNEGAAKLKGVGHAILNTDETGAEIYNQEFQVAFVHEMNELPSYVEQIKTIYLKQNGGKDIYDHLIYDDNDKAANLSDNEVFMSANAQQNSLTPYIYIGVPGFYRKEHVKFCFHRDSQSNVAIVGNDRQSALRLVGIIALQFIRSYKKVGSKVYISDLQKQTEETYNKLSFLDKHPDIHCSGSANLKATMEEVYQLLTTRKQDRANSVYEPEVLYCLLDLKPDGNFSTSSSSSFSFGSEPEKTNMDMLKELIDQGPDLGIHILAYSYNFTNMEELLNNFNNSLLGKMEIKIGLRGGNSFKLFSLYNTINALDKYGEGFIRMPEEMGLKYSDGDEIGDPFSIYNTLGTDKLNNTAWDVLFRSLPNKMD